ncbi:hypothetical protein [Aeoliella mucimassa]|uniref:Uncharacterized protein n=1 Tax=Aeoliella mucimassa TaxID=2527972 RepID=A0A518AP00_9BACT|nr:hypothetical protein [Aeoliella mucimassa]QDU56456.1 hypothetical protein Pan181_26650 [Aeoliella mucimassa]
MLVRTLLAAMVFGLVAVTSPMAQAEEPCGMGLSGGYGYDWGYGIGIGGLYNGLDRYTDYRVPYFAAHPPVYYSHPVPRTYGHSPFAYPPHFRTPDISFEVAPVTITNPYVPSSEKPASVERASDSDETVAAPVASDPLVIVNPYVTPSTYANAAR